MKKNVFLISAFVAVVTYLIYVVLSEKPPSKKHQGPELPYPYYSEEISINNSQAGITLSGTLTLPKKGGNFPVVIMITGSGPKARNEEVFGHKPFLIIADYLTRQASLFCATTIEALVNPPEILWQPLRSTLQPMQKMPWPI
jgi:hypothetical protein